MNFSLPESVTCIEISKDFSFSKSNLRFESNLPFSILKSSRFSFANPNINFSLLSGSLTNNSPIIVPVERFSLILFCFKDKPLGASFGSKQNTLNGWEDFFQASGGF